MKKKRHEKHDLVDVYLQVVEHLHYLTPEELAQLALDAGVCKSTLYNWRGCYVFAPRICTLYAVSRALGYEITMVKRRRKAA